MNFKGVERGRGGSRNDTQRSGNSESARGLVVAASALRPGFGTLAEWLRRTLAHARGSVGCGYLANAASAVMEGMIGIANHFASDESEEWIRLTPPLGDFPHKKGTQRIDAKALTAMANHFGSLRARLERRFGGVPFYVGHPDVPGLANEYPDRRAYGWVMEVQARLEPAGEEGLYGKVKWSEPGKQMLANAHYKFFSPYWRAEEAVENGKRILRPVELVSVGLTNEPNLPVNALANSGSNTEDTEGKSNTEDAEGAENTEIEFMDRNLIINLFGLANTATDEEIKTKLTAAAAALTALANVTSEKAAAETALANERAAHEQTRTALANEKKERATLMVANAIAEGRITAAQKDQWVNDLVTDFAGKSVALANTRASGMKTTARTENAGARREDLANVTERRNILTDLMNAKMAGGLSYDAAWAAVQREKPELFEAMGRKE